MYYLAHTESKTTDLKESPVLFPRFLDRSFGNVAGIPGGSEDVGLDEFFEFIPKSRSSSSIRFFNSTFSVSSCFIYASLSIKPLSDKNDVLLKFTPVPKNWVNAYNILNLSRKTRLSE